MKQIPIKLSHCCAILLVFAIILGAVFNAFGDFGFRVADGDEEQVFAGHEEFESDNIYACYPAQGYYPGQDGYPVYSGEGIGDTGYDEDDEPYVTGGEEGEVAEYGEGDEEEEEYLLPVGAAELFFSFDGGVYGHRGNLHRVY